MPSYCVISSNILFAIKCSTLVCGQTNSWRDGLQTGNWSLFPVSHVNAFVHRQSALYTDPFGVTLFWRHIQVHFGLSYTQGRIKWTRGPLNARRNGGKTAARQHVSCGSSSWIAMSQIDSGLFVSIINVFTRIRMVSWREIYAIWCRSFYVKLAFFIELYLTLQTDFAARRCFSFSANDSFYWTSLPTPGLAQLRSVSHALVSTLQKHRSKTSKLIRFGSLHFRDNWGWPCAAVRMWLICSNKVVSQKTFFLLPWHHTTISFVIDSLTIFTAQIVRSHMHWGKIYVYTFSQIQTSTD